MTDTGAPRAICGPIVRVTPGDVIRSTFWYEAATGTLHVTIRATGDTSEISIPRPFPHAQPPLFASWRELFSAAHERGVDTGIDPSSPRELITLMNSSSHNERVIALMIHRCRDGRSVGATFDEY